MGIWHRERVHDCIRGDLGRATLLRVRHGRVYNRLERSPIACSPLGQQRDKSLGAVARKLFRHWRCDQPGSTRETWMPQGCNLHPQGVVQPFQRVFGP
jgi:hypothetical protein